MKSKQEYCTSSEALTVVGEKIRCEEMLHNVEQIKAVALIYHYRTLHEPDKATLLRVEGGTLPILRFNILAEIQHIRVCLQFVH